MSVLSKVAISASLLPLVVKKALYALIQIGNVAAAGTTQATAGALSEGRTVVTAADGTKGVRLPVGEIDMVVTVLNTVSNQDLVVYPEVGGVINAIAANSAFTVAAGTEATFVCTAALQWYVRASGTLTGVATSASTAQLNVATLAASATRAVTTTASITAADHNGQVLLNSATGFVTTLPAPIAGFQCEVISKLANTSGNHTIVSSASANIIKGNLQSAAGDAGDTGTADDTISFVANSSVAGDRVVFRSDGTSWFVYANSTLAASITFTQAS